MNSNTITLIIGPTKAGKTTELIRQLNRFQNKKEKICFVIPFQSNTKIKENVNHMYSKNASNIINKSIFLESNIIIIDDLHFFEDAELVLPLIANKLNKTIIAASLDNYTDRNPFESIINLIPKCEYVKKLTSFCSVLQDTTPAIFSRESNGNYFPISRKAFLNKNCGFLHVITGPMFSGKTTELLRICKKYQSINKSIMTINYEKDKRYSNTGCICSHNKETIDTTISLSDLTDIFKYELDKYEVIVIDEVQFLKNAFQSIKTLIEDMEKTVIVSGLDGDFLQNPFGDVCRLICFADKVTKLNAICRLSDNFQEASFSRRIAASTETEFIGSEDAYIAVSRQLYNMPEEQFCKKLEEKIEIVNL